MDLNSLMEQMPSFLKSTDRDDDMSRYQSTQRLSFNASRQETQDIKLTTEEGDIVTISSLNQFQASYLSYDYTGSIKDQQALSLDSENLNTSSENAFNISVQGDLNEEEKADIARVLQEMDGIMKDLVDGDFDQIMKSTMSLMDETDTITGIDAVLKFHQQTTLEQRTVTQYQGSGSRPGLFDQGQDNVSASAMLKSASSYVAKISNQILELIEQSSVDSDKLEQPVNSLFANFMNQMSLDPSDPDSALKSQLVEQIQDNVNNGLLPETA